MYGIGKGTVVNMFQKGHTLDNLGDSEDRYMPLLKSAQSLLLHAIEVKKKELCLRYVMMYGSQEQEK